MSTIASTDHPQGQIRRGYIAAVSFADKRYTAVNTDANGKLVVATNGANAWVLDNEPKANELASVVVSGLTQGMAGAAIAKDAEVAVSGGKFITAVTGNRVVGKALEAASAADKLFDMHVYSGQTV